MMWPFHLVVNATRYCMGRRTYAVGEHADWLVTHWGELDEHTRRQIAVDLDREFAADDLARADGWDHKPLGMDCDRREWEKVRALYREGGL